MFHNQQSITNNYGLHYFSDTSFLMAALGYKGTFSLSFFVTSGEHLETFSLLGFRNSTPSRVFGDLSGYPGSFCLLVSHLPLQRMPAFLRAYAWALVPSHTLHRPGKPTHLRISSGDPRVF